MDNQDKIKKEIFALIEDTEHTAGLARKDFEDYVDESDVLAFAEALENIAEEIRKLRFRL